MNNRNVKILISLLLTAYLIVSFNLIAFAAELDVTGKPLTTKKFNEIKDIKALLERAKKGVTDVKNSDLPKALKHKYILKNKKTCDVKEIRTYVTTQLLAIKKINGRKINEYATSFILPENELVTIMATSFSKEEEKYSDGGSDVRTYSTIYWTEDTPDGWARVDLTRVTGGWNILDSHVTIRNMEYTTHANGFRYSDQEFVTQEDTYMIDDIRFDRTVDYSGLFKDIYAIIGVDTYCEIVSSTSTWDLELINSQMW